MGIAQHAVRYAGGYRLPGIAVIGRFVNKRIPVIHLVKIDSDVGRPCLVAGRFNIADGAPWRKSRNVPCDVGPVLSSVASHLNNAVVGARPDQAFLEARLGDSKHDAGVLHADVVSGQAAGESLLALVIVSQVGADDLPALARIGRLVNVLAAHVNLVVIVWRDCKRHGPNEPVLEVGCCPAAGLLWPDLDIPGLAGPEVISIDDAA